MLLISSMRMMDGASLKKGPFTLPLPSTYVLRIRTDPDGAGWIRADLGGAGRRGKVSRDRRCLALTASFAERNEYSIDGQQRRSDPSIRRCQQLPSSDPRLHVFDVEADHLCSHDFGRQRRYPISHCPAADTRFSISFLSIVIFVWWFSSCLWWASCFHLIANKMHPIPIFTIMQRHWCVQNWLFSRRCFFHLTIWEQF